jgi:hypothetical protein
VRLFWFQLLLLSVLASLCLWFYWPLLIDPGIWREQVQFALGRPGVPLILIVLYGMVYGQIGTGFGIQNLFWHDKFWTRVSASCAAVLLLAGVGTVVFLVDTDNLLEAMSITAAASEGESRRYLWRFLAGVSPLALLLLLAPAVLPAAFPGVPRAALAILVTRSQTRTRCCLDITRDSLAWSMNLFTWGLGMVLGCLVTALALWVGVHIQKVLITPWDRDWSAAYIFAFAIVLLLFYAFLSLPIVYRRVVSPPFALCTFMGMVGGLAALLIEVVPDLFPGAGVLALILLLLWFAYANNAPYKLRFPRMTDYYPSRWRAQPGVHPGPVGLRDRVEALYFVPGTRDPLLVAPPPPNGAGETARLVSDVAALNAWSAPFPDKPKLVIVSVSGGAAKAAFWTAVVLDRLEKELPGFGKHVRIITGA